MLTINVITYKIPEDLLIQNLDRLYSTTDDAVCDIRVINNGPPSYLDSVRKAFNDNEVSFLENGPDTRWLSKTWNMAIVTSSYEWAMCASDDIEFNPVWFDEWLKRSGKYDFIGRGFSCFSVKKSAHVGFDEGFRGGGFEDNDYFYRALQANMNMSMEWAAWEKDPLPENSWFHMHADPKRYRELGRSWSAADQKINRDYFIKKYGSEKDFYSAMGPLALEKGFSVKQNKPAHLRYG
jgi:hypothetical protein